MAAEQKIVSMVRLELLPVDDAPCPDAIVLRLRVSVGSMRCDDQRIYLPHDHTIALVERMIDDLKARMLQVLRKEATT